VSESTIVAIVVGFGVPVATFVFTYFSNRQSAEREAARDERRAAHERQLAHESRIHGWRADAYRDLLRVLRRTRLVIEMTLPILDEGRPVPDPPTEAEIDAMEAAVAAFGSETIRERLEAMRRIQNAFFYKVGDYQMDKARGAAAGSSEQTTRYRDVEEIRERYRAAHVEMLADVAAALQELPT